MPASNMRSLVLLIFILASHIPHAPASHHHIKLRHDRHRRQHGESYLPPHFVLDTDEQETGTWGSWSTPSSCSRSCGGGVAYQTRRCNDVDPDGTKRCTGAKKRFFSCNIRDCPEPANDFRAEQCAAYDKTPVNGVLYEWVPYTGASNKCELNCKPRRERFYYRLKFKVTDGTPCVSGQNDVCVEGKCMPVGCDMMLGSGAKEDKCRECGGDNSACDTFHGVVANDNLKIGYNDILLIPAGATNIAISELRPSNNYLAIRNSTGHYYLNGNRTIDFPRSFKFAGTVFRYERRPTEIMTADMVTALGPTNQTIYIVLLKQGKNVGVDYEYSISKRFSNSSDAESYTWVEEEFSDCSSTCGGGFQSRLVKCVRRGDNEEVDANLCDQQLEPVSNVSCGEEACPPEWVIGDWGPCSKACGLGGEQTREIKCEQIISGGIPSLVDDTRCLKTIGPKGIEIQECNKDVPCPQWHKGPWKPCDRLCGQGKERRKITCYKKVDGKIIVLPDSACPEERPESEKDCELRPCAGIDWVVSKWSGCDNKCGLTQETRTVSCVSLDDKIYPNEKCNPETKPELVRSCSAQEKCNYQWYATQWSECSVECGTGIATRKVFCATSDPELSCVTKVEDEKCDPSTRYNDTQECTAEVKECKGEWFSGPWSECSKPCGGGDKTRKVICMKDNKVVPSKDNCREDEFMLASDNCNEKACEQDQVIPEERGKPNAPTDIEEDEECEDYEDDEFISVNQDLGIQQSRNNDEIESSGSGLEDMMMSDDSNALPPIPGPLGDTTEHNDYFDEEGSGSGFSSSFTDDWNSSTTSNLDYGTQTTNMYSSLETSTSDTSLESYGTSETINLDTKASAELDKVVSTKSTEQTISTKASVTSKSPVTTKPENPQPAVLPFEVAPPDVTEPPETTEKSTLPESTTLSAGISSSTRASDSSSTVETTEASDSTVVSSSDETKPSTTLEPSGSEMSSLSSQEASTSSEAGITNRTVSETTVSSDLDTSEESSTNATESTSAGTMESFGSNITLTSSSDKTSTDATVVSSTTDSLTPGKTSIDTTTVSSSEATASSDLTTIGSAGTETKESSESGTIESSGTHSTMSAGTVSTVSTSSETSVASTSDTTGTSETINLDTKASTELDKGVSTKSTEQTISTKASVTSKSPVTTKPENPQPAVLPFEVAPPDVTEPPETTEKSTLPESTTLSAGISSSTRASDSSSTVETTEASDSTVVSSSDETKPSTTLEPSGSEMSSLSSQEASTSSEAGITIRTVSETTVSSDLDTSEESSTNATESTSAGTMESFGSNITLTSSSDKTSTDATVLSSAGTTVTSDTTIKASTSSQIVVSTDSDTIKTSSTDITSARTIVSTSSETSVSDSDIKETFGTNTTMSASIISTALTSSETTVLSSSDTTESSSSESMEPLSSSTPVSSSFQTTELSGSETTESSIPDTSLSSGSETLESSTPDTSVSPSSEATLSSGSGGTVSASSTTMSQSTEFGITSITDGTVTGSTETSKQSTGTVTTTESDVTITYSETTVSGEIDITTESDITSDTTESGVTETDYDLDTTEQSHITEIFTVIGHSDQTLRRRLKCKPKKPKTCKTSPFGCCYDGVKPATGPFGRGCFIPKTCNETKYGCCPDGVSPATGKNNEGCPDSHCSDTLFGCCPDKVTPAEGNDYEGCEIPCNGTEFGCCLDGKTAAAGEDNFGCCNITTYGCCPNGIEPASGPDGEGCEEGETTSTITTPAKETTTEITSEVTDEQTTYTPTTTTEIAKSCEGSKFGCCPNNETSATGENCEGCNIINAENCTASDYKCCPTACQNSKFGCCVDGLTPAHGPNMEGCCLTTLYGCCPDNIQNAKGPNLNGCGCQNSKYGCCPDNTTTALGSNNEGCGCEYAPHGCCPDRLNVAHGPDFEGCPCHTYQFGCCPDGISFAKGPLKQGCGCENTKFNCCSDGLTPAKGPNYAGCTCDVSKYGCCPDGIEEAQGENFEGCHRVLLSPAAICTLNEDKGPCMKWSVKWYYNVSNGMCQKFWYGGCEGNENRFHTQQECKNTCVEPKGRDVCFLPKVVGPCDGYYPTWYYDTDRKQCAQFIYGGCLGNANKFNSKEDCEELCVVPDDDDRCEQPNEPGPCEGNFTRWYFNAESSSCEEFNYGGCRGNENNFQTEISCKQQCVIPRLDRVRDVCNLEKEPGPCPGSLLRWYYDAKHKSCRQFVYGGCKGNGNKFRTYAACEQRCPHREQDSCLLPAIIGECFNYTQRWYYDSTEKHCRRFYYGGCGGNGNNFETEHDCIHRCESSSLMPAPTVDEFRREYCFLPENHGPCRMESVRWYYDSRSGICQQFYYGGCQSNGNNFGTVEECENQCGNVQDPCDLPAIVGPCRGSIRQYYYDRRTDMCHEFAFGGCQGNKNRFEDKKSCEQRCRKTTDATTLVTLPATPRTRVDPESSSCFAPLDFGPCRDNITAFYYDAESQTCQAFLYGGCEGNANRFQSLEQCERVCGSFRGQDVCNLPLDPGPCNGLFPRFFYDSKTRECHSFMYGGCLGNGNRFTFQYECESVCVHREEPPAPGNRTTYDNTAICLEPVNSGYYGGSGHYKRFYYDDERLDCIAFIYQGSGGNLNRFKSRESCLKTCSKTNEVGPEFKYPEDSCINAQKECNEIRCQYGMVARVDEQNCERCSCVDPCLPVKCQEGSKCVITSVLRGESAVYQGTCESLPTVTKPGMCPAVVNGASCQEECDSDAECPEDLKCCPSSCGSSCLKPAAAVQPVPVQPVPTEPLPTPPPVPAVTTIPNSQLVPAVIEQPKEPKLRAEQGSYVIMKCVAIGNPRPVISWRRGVTLIDNSMGRHSINDDGSLQIVGLYSADAGIYTCTAHNRLAAPVRIQYELDITDPRANRSSTIFGKPNYRVTVSLNSPAYLKCFVMGWPRPIVNWWHEGEMISLADDVYELQRDYALKIHTVSLANLGIYTCQAYNGVGKAASWSVTLQAPGPVINVKPEYERYIKYLIDPSRLSSPVRTRIPDYPQNRPMRTKAPVSQTYAPIYPPSQAPYILTVNITEPPPAIVLDKYTVPVKVNVTAEDGQFPVGSDFSILCNVYGYPIPTVQWYKDDRLIQTTEKIKIVEANRLSISYAQKNDSGKYRCEAANQYSSDSDSVDIVVSGIYIHPTCQDNLFLANCGLIVKGKFCHHPWYARFCCRSCTEAGQLPPRGPHLNETSRKRRSILSTP
ncbi:papilin isoform X2 [Neodiprion lecontei]|uniref:Papilin isoform X2 n=1 Tax=Neodiprion lecontei TaxID=441921 RepID=A0ABM3FFB6_NEOLC|nr:papilin isoform X2 [Neodiprion lecontei]